MTEKHASSALKQAEEALQSASRLSPGKAQLKQLKQAVSEADAMIES